MCRFCGSRNFALQFICAKWTAAFKTTFRDMLVLMLVGICVASSDSKLFFEWNKTWTATSSPKGSKNKEHNSCGPRVPIFFGTLSGACLIVPQTRGIRAIRAATFSSIGVILFYHNHKGAILIIIGMLFF